MALDREVVVRFRARSDRTVVLRNADARFPPVVFTLADTIPPDPPGAWGNYPRAAAQALCREGGIERGLEGEVSTSLPVAAGLSSSSALVVATALALLDANRLAVEPLRLMDLLARAERYTKVQGGGMDQAVSVGGRAGHAVRIDFRPRLTLTWVPVPDSWRFVIAGSGIEAAKSADARAAYNTRVRESREALRSFAAASFQGQLPADYGELLDRMPTDDILVQAGRVLDGVLLRRFRHVVSEGQRVNLAEAALRQNDPDAFGALMCASHASLRDDYAVSVPALDALVEQALAAGAAGARLTGAGFGGSIVALATADRADQVVAALRAATLPVFVATPGPGARVEPGEHDTPGAAG